LEDLSNPRRHIASRKGRSQEIEAWQLIDDPWTEVSGGGVSGHVFMSKELEFGM